MNQIKTFESFINESLNEGQSKLDTKTFIEPKEMESTLSQIYYILRNNQRDYLELDGLNELISVLKKYAK